MAIADFETHQKKRCLALWLTFLVLGLIVLCIGIWSIIQTHEDAQKDKSKRTEQKATAIAILILGIIISFLSAIMLGICESHGRKLTSQIRQSIAENAVTLEEADQIKSQAESSSK